MIVDGCAGPGGWEEGLRLLGHSGEVLGIEWNEQACATARAAGHQRLQADVAAIDPRGLGDVEGVIFSPPCPTYSAAGKGAGRRDIDHVIACARELAGGRDTRAEHRARCEDERSILTVEPLRYALELRPTWIALEQVPPVLPIWEVLAELLREHGYSCWTGVLEAERYGVPQTRERAILMARRDGRTCHPPAPTHQRYVPGEPARHDVTLEGEILPWVSMAETLGWAGLEDLVGFPRRADTPSESSGSIELDGEEYRERDLRAASEPAFNLTEKARSWQRWAMSTGNFTAIARDADGERSRAGSVPYERDVDQPSPTITGAALSWSGAGSTAHIDIAAVRVTVEEASVLQTFPAAYPWAGTQTQKFQQIGNAVPPVLAAAILAELLSSD